MLDILLIDDEPEFLEITYEQLKLNYKNVNITRATSGNEGISLLMSGKNYDIIISDYNMPNGSGLELLKYKNAFDYPGYFIFHTNNMNPVLPCGMNKLFLGVIDKLNFDKLFNCITNCIENSAKLKSKIS